MAIQTPTQEKPTVEKSTRTKPSEIQFSHFGVLNAGKQSRGSFFTALILNVTAALIILLLTAAVKKQQHIEKLSRLDAPIPRELKEAPKPKPIPVLPKPPKIAVVEPPKINVPKIEVPEPPKIQTPVMKAAPVPVPTPAPPKAVTPPPAPVVIKLNQAQATSVANNDAHPSAIRLGSQTNPIKNVTGPAVSPVNLGRAGAPGMPAGNTGLGPASKINIGGSGAPNGRMGGTDNSAHAVVGVKLGTLGATGPVTARPVGAIQIASTQPQAVRPTTVPPAAARTPPKLVFKPKPVYTAEARQLHLEGTVYVKIHLTAAGAVQVIGISSGLGHGLDQAAIQAVEGMRFSPAMQDGHPVDWDGVVNINFQLAG